MARIRALLTVGTLIAAASLGGVAAASTAAGADGAHRALVIVDTGGSTYQRVVTFDTDSITGMQALSLAGANPVVYTYAGQGGAVCRLFGTGRDAGPNCLGGGDGDNRYWAYFRAASGTSTFAYSRGGAGSAAVHHGDVEGWNVGTGDAPARSAVPSATTTTTTAPLVSPGGGSGPAVASSVPVGSGGPPVGATPEQIAAFWAAAAAGTTTTTTSSTAPATHLRGAFTRRAAGGSGRVAASRNALPADSGDGSGSGSTGWGSIVGFAAAAAAIVGIGLYLRRLRSRPIP